MSYGLVARNDDNYVQIDSDNPRLCALYSGTYQASGSEVVTVSFPQPVRTIEPPCIFIRNASQQILYRETILLGSAGSWTGFRLSAGNTTQRPSGKWFVAVFASRSAAIFGMRMWDENGVIIYDSGATPVIFTKATNSWIYNGKVQIATSNAYFYSAETSGQLLSDEYFMINPFSRGLNGPQANISNWLGVVFDHSANRLQAYVVGVDAWVDSGLPGAVFARLPGT